MSVSETVRFSRAGGYFEGTVDTTGLVSSGSTGTLPVAVVVNVPGTQPFVERLEIKMVAADPQGRNRFAIKAARQEKGLGPLPRLDGASAPQGAPVPAGAPQGGPGGEQRFRDSRPPGPPPPRQEN